MVLRLLRALPGVPGFLATIPPEFLTPGVDSSIGEPEPHGLTVRLGAHHLTRFGVHRNPPHVW